MEFYQTITQEGSAEFRDRGSRFIAVVFPVKTAEDFKKRIQVLKKEHPKAVHHCFAYRLGTDGNLFRSNDDGEPSGSAGKPILGQIDSKGLTDVAVVVVRYFGGTLLGVPGLIHAYKTVTSLALQVVPTVQKPLMVQYTLQFDYTATNEIMQVVRQLQCEVVRQDLQLFSSMVLAIPKSRREEALYRFKELRNVEIEELV